MQRKPSNYDPETMHRWHALVLPQPHAQAVLFRGAHIEITSHACNYVGRVLVCSSETPRYPHLYCGAVLGAADLITCIPVAEMTAEDWELTRIARDKRGKIRRGYALVFANVRRVIEMPCVAKKGIRTLIYDADDITEYPEQVFLDKKAWRKIQKSK